MARKPGPLGMTPEQSKDLGMLLDHLTHVRKHGQHVPCQETDDSRPWTSENAAERAQAVHACYLCDAVAECRAYGIKYPKEIGIIGGLTSPERQKINRRKRWEAKQEGNSHE